MFRKEYMMDELKSHKDTLSTNMVRGKAKREELVLRRSHRSSFHIFGALYVLALCLSPDCSSLVSAFAVVKQRNAQTIERIVFGTAALAKAENPLDLLDAAYKKGFYRFDLARTYGDGKSESLFGEWMSTRGIQRDEVYIITKGGMGKDKYGSPDRPLLTFEGLREEADASLRSLGVATVDLYMFHRDDPRIPTEVFVQWANELINSGDIKRWGVSNWSFERFTEAFEFATASGLEPPSGNSPQFSLAVPKCEVWPTTQSISAPEYMEQIEWYQEKRIELFCWEVLAKGFMAKPDIWPEHEVDPSTFDSPVEIGSDEWRVQRIQRAYCHAENYRRRNVARKLADSFGCELSQVAALYPLSIGSHINVLVGCTKAHHLDDKVELQHLRLDEEAMFALVGETIDTDKAISKGEIVANNVFPFNIDESAKKTSSVRT